MNLSTKQTGNIIAILLVSLLLLATDCLYSSPDTIAILYAIPVLISIRLSDRRVTYSTVILSTVFVVAGMFFNEGKNEIYSLLADRILIITTLWIITVLVAANLDKDKGPVNSGHVSADLRNEYIKELEKTQRMAQTGSWRLDIRTGHLEWSDELYRIMGIDKDKEVTTDIFYEILHPEDREELLKDTMHMIETGQVHDIEYRVVRPDGSERTLFSWRDVITDDEGNVVAIRGTVQDITDRKKIEDSLRKSEENLRRYFDSALIGLAIGTPERNWLQVNDTYCNLVGYTREELQKMKWSDLTHPDDLQHNLDIHQRVLDGKLDRYTIDKRYIRKDGKVVYVTISAECIRNEDGTLNSVVTFIQDITDRRMAIRKMEELMFAIDNATDAVLLIDSDSRIFYVNQSACSQLGYSYNELVGMCAFELDPALTQERRDSIRTGDETEVVHTFETLHRKKDGTGIPVEVTISYAVFEGRLISVVFVKDITERKAAARKMEELQFAIDNAVDLIYILNENGEIYYANKRACETLGYSYEEVRILSVYDIDPDCTPEIYEKMWTDVLSGKLEKIETLHRRKDGTEFPVEISISTRYFDGVGYSCAFARDITERKASERQMEELKFAVENAVDSVYLINEDGSIFYVNKSACDCLGYTYEELTSMNILDFNPNFPRDEWPGLINEIRAGKLPSFEAVHRRKDGSLYPAEVTVNLKNYEGMEYLCAFARDITERKHALQQLEILQFAIDNSVIPFYFYDYDANITYANKSACEALGYTYDELTGLKVYDIDPGVTPDIWKTMYENVKAGKAGTIPSTNKRKDGTIFPVEVTPTNMTFGEIEFGCSMNIDISERIAAEKAARESEEKFFKVVDASLEAVIITSLEDGKVLYVNPAFTNIFNFTEEEAIGRTTTELNIWEEIEDRRILVEMLEEESEVRDYEMSHRIKSGEIIPMSTTASLIDIDGEKCIVCWSRDLSRERKDQQEKRRMEQQLFRSQKMDAIGQLTGGIAHDFNNILVSILGYNNLALRRSKQLDDAKLTAFLREVRHGGERARELIEQMLMYSRGLPGEASRQSLPPLINNIMRLLRPTLPSSIDIQLQLPENVPQISIDPAQFEQLIMNLCINARDAIPDNGNIDIELYQAKLAGTECASCHVSVSGDYIVVSVKDSGQGMADDIKQLVFDPFYTTKEVGKGTGMGLSMVHGIVHNCSGHILLESSLGRGTTFSLLFPMPEQDERRAEVEGRVDNIEPDLKDKHGVIMVVDDEPAIAGYLGELLKDEGYEVRVMTNSVMALDAFRGAPYEIDLVLTDQTMPGITGTELSSELLKINPRLPIVLCTGYSEQISETKAKMMGIKGYLKKPVEEHILMENITDLINEDRVA